MSASPSIAAFQLGFESILEIRRLEALGFRRCVVISDGVMWDLAAIAMQHVE